MKPLMLLHTSPVHVGTFGRLLTELAPQLRLCHIVKEPLLSDAGADALVMRTCNTAAGRGGCD